MKLTINQNGDIQETEIIINCSVLDQHIRNLSDYIRQYSLSLEGEIDTAVYYVPLDNVLYIDSVDKRTFFYDRRKIYSSQFTLAELEEKLKNTSFMRISKNCIVNLAFVHCTIPCENHRMELVMVNGEHLIVARSYKNAFQERLRFFHADAFRTSTYISKDIFEHDLERSVYNAGKILSFPICPKRVVALSYENAELMAALGIEDRLVAVAPAECRITQVSPQYRSKIESIPILTDHDRGIPTLLELKGLELDFIFGSFYSLQTLEKVSGFKIDTDSMNLYITEGTVPESATMESVYRDILNLGRIFQIENRSIQLVEQMRKRIATLTRQVGYCSPVRVFVYDGAESMPYTAMGGTLENNLISIAGGENIFAHTKGTYAPVTWEQVTRANPDVIILHDYEERLSISEKISVLNSRLELRDIPAVKNSRYITLSLTEVFPGIQNTKTVEKLISGFYPNLF